MATLGLHVGLNSSVALVDADGGLVWAEQEERHSRVKNHCGFPAKALVAAHENATKQGLTIERVAVGGHIVFPHDMSRSQLLEAYSGAFSSAQSRSERRDQAADGQATVRQRLADLLPGSYELVTYDHHLCHAASAYHFLRSDTEPYLVITLDGEGDGLSGTVWRGAGGELELVAASQSNASLGLLYFWVTYLMGLQPHEDEHKVMGLAGHVDPDYAHQLGAALFSRLLDVDEEKLEVVLPGLDPTDWLRVLKDACYRVRFDHLAGAVQAFVEGLAARLVTAAVSRTGLRRVLLAGGVAMNVKLNRALRRLDSVDRLDAMPSAGDESLAVGAAFLAAASLSDADLPLGSPTPLVGSELVASDVHRSVALAKRDGCRVTASGEDAVAVAADALIAGEPVGICVGRAEFGARALGHRSLLAHPGSPGAVAKLNSAVKQRDFWMPFAPALLEHRADDLLLDYDGAPSRWMMHTFQARPDERLRGAVHSTDWTCRPQMLAADDEDPLAAILRRVEEAAGLPAVVNTSLNEHGDPIARTPADAVAILRRSPLQYLLLGDQLLDWMT